MMSRLRNVEQWHTTPNLMIGIIVDELREIDRVLKLVSIVGQHT